MSPTGITNFWAILIFYWRKIIFILEVSPIDILWQLLILKIFPNWIDLFFLSESKKNILLPAINFSYWLFKNFFFLSSFFI
jgi:hypothetical protein